MRDVVSDKRIQWIDLVRALATLLVILCHVVEGVYDMDINGMGSLGFWEQIFVFLMFTVSRMAVPFFLMITGYLMLDRRYDGKQCEDFVKGKWVPLLVCTEIWFVIYDFLLYFLDYEEVDLIETIEDVLFFRAVNMTHVWFLPMMLGLYLLIPFAANAIHDLPPRSMRLPIIIYTFFAFVFPVVQVLETTVGDKNLKLQFAMGFSGGAYGLYMLFGFMVKKGVFKQFRFSQLMAMALLNVTLAVLLQMYCFSKGVNYKVWYDCIFLAVASLLVFEMFSRIKRVHAYRLFRRIAYYSFGVYLVHNIYRSLLVVNIDRFHTDESLQGLFLYFATLALTMLTLVIIDKIPGLGKFLIYSR